MLLIESIFFMFTFSTSKKLDWLGGWLIVPAVIGLELGNKISKKMLSISRGKAGIML